MKISERYWGEIKKCAEKRGIVFDLTIDEAWRIFLSQNQRCAFTGLPIDLTSKGYRGTASLDRIDSDMPYTKYNVQWVESSVQIMKGSNNETYFKKMCHLVDNPVHMFI